jgi:outer membrane protein TolC
LLLSLVLTSHGCVTYDTLEADIGTVAVDVRARQGGTFTFPEAVSLAMRQNAGLQAAAARARAAGAVTEPVLLESEWKGDDDRLALMLDPLELLGIGPRGGALAVASAEQAAAVQALAEARWQVTAAIAEAWLVEQVLARWQAPVIAGDAAAFERAGLASPVAAGRLRAAQAQAQAEAAEVQSLRAQNRDALRRLLGLGAAAVLEVQPVAEELLAQPPAGDASLQRRPDLLLQQARLQVADAEFRRAVADQYPSLMIGPDIPLASGSLDAMARVRLPIGMHGKALAARERREAALAELTEAWIAAGNEAQSRETALGAAVAGETAAAAARQATEQALRMAQVGVQVETDAFDRLADAAVMAVREAVDHRMAALTLVQARVRRAVAFGWPLVKVQS